MRQAVGQQDGTYKTSSSAALLGTVQRVLSDAVPPVAPDALLHEGTSSQETSYGWYSGTLPAPRVGDRYVVEFIGKNEVRVLAYIDRFGRAFTMDAPSASPPAREPDLAFVRFPGQDEGEGEAGCVEVRYPDGERHQVAQYRCTGGRYTIFDSWYHFGQHGSDIPYDDAIARCYLAFVYRPLHGGAVVPARGLDGIEARLQAKHALVALRSIMADVLRAEADPALRPPALACSLVHWLGEAGLDGLKDERDDALRLVRTVRYSNLYFLAMSEADTAITQRTIWALEAALNRYALVKEAFGDQASAADDIDCARWDAYLIETIALQSLDAAHPVDRERVPVDVHIDGVPGGPPVEPVTMEVRPSGTAGEWDVRRSMAIAFENVRVPYRFAVEFRVDVDAGIVAVEATVPDKAFMPTRRWDEASAGWEPVPDVARAAQALRYACHLGIVFVAAAFHHAGAVNRVDFTAYELADEDRSDEGDTGGEFPREKERNACCSVSFMRDRFCFEDAYRGAAAGDPLSFYQWSGAWLAGQDMPEERGLLADAFSAVTRLPSHESRRDLPEVGDALLAPVVREALGAEWAHDMRISVDAMHRRAGERLADHISSADNDTEAIRMTRAMQEKATDPFEVEGCTRVMAALAEGELDVGDQNAVMGRFLGEDRWLTALAQARTYVERDPRAAVGVLADALAEAELSGRFADDAEVVYRTFDSYASRVLYNRACKGSLPDVAEGLADTRFICCSRDVGKRVELVPDSLYLCYLEAVRLLEHSFEQADEALRYGERAIELAPTVAAGYRRLARAYMLVGDMDNAITTLDVGLNVAVQPNDIAIAYYQMAYALWKVGKPQVGAVCYVKSMLAAPVVALQATAELQELLGEGGVPLPEQVEVDEELARFGVPLAPTDTVLKVLLDGAEAATNAGLFPVARNLLLSYLRYRPDDALASVARSLAD